MGHPKKNSRRIYFNHIIDKETIKQHNIDLEKWIEDTEDMSIAHMKELFITVCILGNDYDESIEILRSMIEDNPSSKEENNDKIGFRRR
jgi:hypothetical protein